MTRKEWFESINDSKITRQAIQNTHHSKLHHNVQSLSVAIMGGFNWTSTPQGGNYWADIYNTASKNPEKLLQSNPINVIKENYTI